MGPGDFGPSPFDEFFARFFGPGGPRPGRRVDIGALLSDRARQLVAAAVQRATEWGAREVGSEHLLWGATQVEPTRELLARAGAAPEELAGELDRRVHKTERSDVPPSTLSPTGKRVLLDAHQISRSLGSTYIGPEHLLLALAANPETLAGQVLAESRITPEALQQAAARGQAPASRGTANRSDTPTLDQFGTDVTAMARDGKLDPVVGRGDEIEQTVEVLSRRTKNNPVLIGEAGVGKTAIVEGIAQRIVEGDVPDTLANRRVVQLDLSGMVAGTRYRGDFEERAKNVIDEIRGHADELIVFIDELHMMVGAGSTGTEGTMDVGNMLKPALARGELHVIGATTLDEYRQSIEKDAALNRRFQPILVPEPSVEDTVEILRTLRDRYEAHHQVRFTDEALVAAAELSDRYVSDRFLPDKAIDLIDQAGARVRLRTRVPSTDLRELEGRLDELTRNKDQAVADEQYERASELRDQIAEVRTRIEQARRQREPTTAEVHVQDVAEIVSRSTGIPVSQLTQEEKERLLNLEEQLHRRVVGQDDAVAAIAEAVRRSRSGLGDPDRPVGSFLFLGPTGVGKTELAKALAEALFGSDDRMVRVDMSEFQERHTVSRLVGAPPGYVGYGESGELTEAVRRRPYSVVLLDEIEKAHQDVFNLLLQVLDDGRLTDGQGRTVDFRNTVLVMTSNVGSDLIAGSGGTVGFVTEQPDASARTLEERLRPRLRETFRPEFLNRVDEVIVFRRLEPAQLREITGLILEDTERRLHGQDIGVEFTDAAVAWIADRGYQPEFGARPIRRTVQREVDNRLSSMLLSGAVAPGQHVTVTTRDGELAFDVS
ncbi:MAG: ATP-dependent Clp protease ATP-binding subunit [Streptosporangiales bacterium]|nr:ATP-dependent Clp protease ATP-binding subunit [Streptosporangiales bacterium]MBO0889677.1 ATP-dependent Clp protease ATP-binding subunit [Acidothermales bacterium]